MINLTNKLLKAALSFNRCCGIGHRQLVFNQQLSTSSILAFKRQNQQKPERNSSDLDDELKINEPIPYFGSNAPKFTAQQSQSGIREELPWYQPLVVVGSVAVFLIYFCILREENDVDKKFTVSLFDHVAGLEENQLKIAYQYNVENGLPTKELENRLLEIQQEKVNLSNKM